MKEFDFTFEKGLTKGLRRFRTNPRNQEALVDCHNWMPMEQGVEAHEALTDILAGTGFFLLLENGDFFLLENGDKLII